MKFVRRINIFFDRIEHDIRLFAIKPSIILSCFSLFLGILSWVIGGRADRVMLIYIFPRSAISLEIMYFLWALSFAFIGLIVGGVIFGCEKYKKREAGKIVVFLILTLLFMLCVHPTFFKSLSPFFAFVFLLLAGFFCLLAIFASIRIYSLWTICLTMHLFWLLYNGFLALTITLIN
ncbi:MAG: hypothetical protein E7596_01190 [Ruminococcaceae bacterium]|nr:hypothetical protein [Oscillospiraceae bacterium]